MKKTPDVFFQLRTHFDAVLLCAGVAIMLTTFVPIIHSDGMARFEAVRDLMRGVVFPTKYSLIQPALTVPLVYVGRFFYVGIWSDRKSTRLNSSHSQISYAVFCLKKKK